jgi:hypothetical protein
MNNNNIESFYQDMNQPEYDPDFDNDYCEKCHHELSECTCDLTIHELAELEREKKRMVGRVSEFKKQNQVSYKAEDILKTAGFKCTGNENGAMVFELTK